MTATAAPALSVPPIVTSRWLVGNLNDVVVIDTRRAEDFLAGHIPGAISFPLGSLLVEDTSRNALVNLGRAAQQALAARGVSANDTVVLIDDNDGSASLGVFICQLAGVRRVALVHGGVRSWVQEGAATQIAPSTREPVDFDGTIALGTFASLEEVEAAVDTATRLVDARSQLEHEGIVGTPCCAKRGAIPGSVHLEWTSLLSATGDLHGPDRVLAEARHVGLDEGDDVVVYCHTGHRAAIAGLALRAAGFTRVRTYLGSWHEWSHRGRPELDGPGTPAATKEHAAIA